MRRRNSLRVATDLRKEPRMALVTMQEFCYWTPRIILKRW